MNPEHKEIPIRRTIGDAYRLVFGHFGGMWKAALISTALFVVLVGAAAYLAVFTESAGSSEAMLQLLQLVLIFAGVVVFVPFLSQWHRVGVLGPDREPPRISFRFGRREWRFFLYCLGIMLVGVIIFLVPLGALVFGYERGDELVPVVGFGLFWVMLYVVARISFVLPATAVDHNTSFREAWKQSKGNGVRVAIALFLAELPWRILESVAGTVAEDDDLIGLLVLYAPLTVIIAVVSLAILASVLAISYKTLVGVPDPAMEHI